MRILLVSKACLVGVYQKKLEAIASHDDIDLTVIVPPSWDDPAGRVLLEKSHIEGYDFLVDPMRLNGNYHLHYYPQLGKRLTQIQPDILHMDEEPYNLATYLAVKRAKKQGVKSLFFSWQNLHRTYPIPFRWLESYVLQTVDYALVGNQDSAQVWRQKGYKGPLTVIPQFGVDPHLFMPATQSDQGRGFVIGATGRRLVPEKGLDILLKAVAKLSGIWRLHIVGEGPEQAKLQQQAKELGIADRVFFDGAIPSQQMPAYLQQLDVLVLPSRTLPNWKEQFGRVLTEAMACEVAVVGSNSGEIPHVIGDAGIVFAEDNHHQLHTALQTLMQNPPKRIALGKAGRQRVLARYTQSQVAAQTVAVYREMMEQA